MTGWCAQILTLYPDMFPGPLGQSLAGKALEAGIWHLDVLDIRGFARDKHRTVDDTPAGGGPGMVMKPDVVAAAIDAGREKQDLPLLVMSPRGRPLSQERVAALAEGPGVAVLCGRFEGIDQRVIDARGGEEVSVGDVVLSGGEIAGMALIDAAVRLLPGVMGAGQSAEEESFTNGILEYPQYTRPQSWEGHEIPPVLLSGHHGEIEKWRRRQAEQDTKVRRPDLWARYTAKTND